MESNQYSPNGDSVGAERKLTFMTASEIAEQVTENVEWVARPWVASGAITEIDGQVKMAGKTTWVTHMCRKILEGESFMGEPTLRTPIVYLTEQPPISFRVALKRADLLQRDDLHVLFWNNAMGTPWAEIVKAAMQKVEETGSRLLIVDTLAQFAGLLGDKENNAGDALQAMKPLQAAAGIGVGVLIVRHENKRGGTVGKSGRGSSAFTGAVDIVLSMRAEGGPDCTVRVIESIGRFDETPARLAIDYAPGKGYTALGEEHESASERAKDPILAALPLDPSDAIRIETILEHAALSRATAQRALDELLGQKVGRIGEGRRNDPFRYHLLENFSAQAAIPMDEAEKESGGAMIV